MIAGLAELVLGQVAAENFLLRSSLVVILAGLVWFHCGGYVLRLLAFPLGFLLFMIPIPATIFYAVAFPLQRFAAANAAAVLDLLGIPVLLDGNVMHLSTISLGVTEACSGIRSLISLLALAVAWAYLTLPGIGSMALLIAAAIPITIVANVGRVVTTGLTAEWFGARYAEGFFHSFSGWLIFLIAFGGLFAVHTGIGLARRLLRKWR
jgi:exosortase